jgi:hypothetical protein
MMKRVPVSSSCLKSVGHDAQRRVLELEFTNQGLYQYLNVPAEEHQALLDAESLGTYFNEEIKNRYRFLMIRPPRRGSSF